MKRITLIIALCFATFMGASAQAIIQNNKFWDGEYLYTAHVQKKAGVVELRGMSLAGDQRTLTLKKGKKSGEYTLQRDGDEPPYGCMWGSRVQYIRKGNTNFLGFYVEEHTIGQALVLTTENLVTCATRQQRAETVQDPISLASDMLFNQHYLFTVGPEIQQTISNYLQSLSKRNIVEQTNMQMLSYALSLGLGADGLEPGEIAAQGGSALDDIVSVSNEREFLEAIGSNRTIRIADGTTLFITNMLNDEAFFNKAGRAWRNDYYSERSGTQQLVVSCERFDGRQLEIVNVHNLVIKGGKNCHIIVSPRYANVLNFYSCSNIKIENLTLGHTDEGHCEGGVIYAEGCNDIRVSDCDLYGCGTYGVETHGVDNLLVERTIIRDCSYGIMTLLATQYCTFQDCDFLRCREYGLLETDDACRFVTLRNCRFAGNKGTIFSNASPITLVGCKIYHDDALGDGAHMVEFEGDDNAFYDEYIENPSPRNIGPR